MIRERHKTMTRTRSLWRRLLKSSSFLESRRKGQGTAPQKRSGEVGSYTVEAALFLPVFLLGVLTLVFFIKGAGISGAVTHIALDETRALAVDAYSQEVPLSFEEDVKERILESCADVDTVEITDFEYLYSQGDQEGLIRLSFTATIPLPLTLLGEKAITLEREILCHGWIGEDPSDEAMDFSAMEKEGTSQTVYVFPQSGTKYHGATCTYIANTPVQRILTDALRKKYNPCETCHPEDLENGAIVFCYLDYGTAYHQEGCRHLEKYIVEMEKEDEEARGYSPCSKCGGE